MKKFGTFLVLFVLTLSPLLVQAVPPAGEVRVVGAAYGGQRHILYCWTVDVSGLPKEMRDKITLAEGNWLSQCTPMQNTRLCPESETKIDCWTMYGESTPQNMPQGLPGGKGRLLHISF